MYFIASPFLPFLFHHQSHFPDKHVKNWFNILQYLKKRKQSLQKEIEHTKMNAIGKRSISIGRIFYQYLLLVFKERKNIFHLWYLRSSHTRIKKVKYKNCKSWRYSVTCVLFIFALLIYSLKTSQEPSKRKIGKNGFTC